MIEIDSKKALADELTSLDERSLAANNQIKEAVNLLLKEEVISKNLADQLLFHSNNFRTDIHEKVVRAFLAKTVDQLVELIDEKEIERLRNLTALLETSAQQLEDQTIILGLADDNESEK